MGTSKIYFCRDCGTKYEVNTGTGYMFSVRYKIIMKHIAEGRYGEKRAELYRRYPTLAVDAGYHYYECEDCGYWNVKECMDLYRQKGRAREMEYDYVMPEELKDGYTLVNRYKHICPECEGKMVQRDRVRNIRCPECGTVNKYKQLTFWG